MRIFVDAMGGDLAPQAPVEGTVEALRRNPELTVTLAGIVPEIEKYLAGADDVRSRITLLDAPEVITNHESPVMGVRKKTKSATVLGMLAVRDKEADGFVSAGSTGAVLAGGMFRLGRIPGVERPALAPLMPNGKGYFLLIDCGANVDCKPEYLTQFGVMGDAYMCGVMGIEKPRIGIINIGAEDEKGNALVKDAFPMMAEAPYHFVGSVEARDLFSDCGCVRRGRLRGQPRPQNDGGRRDVQDEDDEAGTDGRYALEDRRGTGKTGSPPLEAHAGLHRSRRRTAAGRARRSCQGARFKQRARILPRH